MNMAGEGQPPPLPNHLKWEPMLAAKYALCSRVVASMLASGFGARFKSRTLSPHLIRWDA